MHTIIVKAKPSKAACELLESQGEPIRKLSAEVAVLDVDDTIETPAQAAAMAAGVRLAVQAKLRAKKDAMLGVTRTTVGGEVVSEEVEELEV